MAIITFPYPDYESMSVGYLMSVCLAQGHQVELLHYKSHNSLFNKRFEIDFEKLAAEIIEKGTQIAAFSCVTDIFNTQLKLAETLKRLCPEILCIFGGVHITALPDKILALDPVDCVALGESDNSLARLLENMQFEKGQAVFPDEPVAGMVFKKEGERVGCFELPEYPQPHTWHLPYKKSFYEVVPEARNTYLILTSRGCPYQCAYCYNSSSFLDKRRKGYLRQRTVDDVIDELVWAKASFAPKSVWFVDDCFTSDTQWLLALCREYKEKVDLPFACLTHPLSITDEKVHALKNAGCYSVQIGVQSLSEKVCNLINRKGNKQAVSLAILRLKQKDILVAVDHIFGLPGDTLQFQEEAVLFYNELRPFWVSTFWLNYYPGTAVVETARQMGLLSQGEVEGIENGVSNDNKGYMITAGHLDNKKEYYGLVFLLNWMPFIPKNTMRFLIQRKWYRRISVSNYFATVLVPRGLRSFHPKFPRRGFHLQVLFALIRETLARKIGWSGR